MSRRLLATEGRFWLGARGSGSVFARCGCRDKRGRRRGTSCPRLGEVGHGSWYFSLDLPRHVDGGRRRLRRGGYLTCDAAEAARDRLSVPQPGDSGGRVLTVADWLETWVETRVRLRDSTRRIYRSHIQQHLRRLFDEGMIPATARRVFSTLRTALNAAARERLIPDDPARYVKLPPGSETARGGLDEAAGQGVETHRDTARGSGMDPSPARAVPSLHRIALALRRVPPDRDARLRRGEACGLKWEDLDLDDGLAYLSRQIQEGPDGRLRACPLKTESSCRAVAMDTLTVTVLRAHHSWQRRWLSESGIETQGWVFTDEIGRPLSPDCLTRTFNRLVEESGLPPVRLHDFRHGAATLMLLAGHELKTIADQLGHSSVVLTADTYLSVAVELGLKSAAEAARLVLKAGKRPPGGGDIRRRSAPVLVEITV